MVAENPIVALRPWRSWGTALSPLHSATFLPSGHHLTQAATERLTNTLRAATGCMAHAPRVCARGLPSIVPGSWESWREVSSMGGLALPGP